jgi:putative oxidoreductase
MTRDDDNKFAMGARTLIAILFILSGGRKLMNLEGTAKYFGSLGFPMPEIVAPLTGGFEIVAGIMLIVGWRVQIVAAVLALFTLATGFLGHKFWAAPPAQFDGHFYNFFKNLSIVGSLLMVILYDRAKLYRR